MEEKEDDTSFDALIEHALDNAIQDRFRAIEAFERTKHIYNVEIDQDSGASGMQGLMLIGQNVSKLLEIAQKSNEQVIKLATLKKDKSKKTESDDDGKPKRPFDLDELESKYGH